MSVALPQVQRPRRARRLAAQPPAGAPAAVCGAVCRLAVPRGSALRVYATRSCRCRGRVPQRVPTASAATMNSTPKSDAGNRCRYFSTSFSQRPAELPVGALRGGTCAAVLHRTRARIGGGTARRRAGRCSVQPAKVAVEPQKLELQIGGLQIGQPLYTSNLIFLLFILHLARDCLVAASSGPEEVLGLSSATNPTPNPPQPPSRNTRTQSPTDPLHFLSLLPNQ